MIYTLLPPGDQNATPGLPARDALRESEAYFRSLVENARDVIHVLNPDRTTRYITPSIKRLLGWEPEELIGRSVMEFVHPDDMEPRAGRSCGTSRASRAGAAASRCGCGTRTARGASSRAWCATCWTTPWCSGVVVNSRDITERRRREEQVRRLAAIPQESPNPILECDLGGNPIYVNPAAEAADGRDAAGRRRCGCCPPDHRRIVHGCVRERARARGGSRRRWARACSRGRTTRTPRWAPCTCSARR